MNTLNDLPNDLPDLTMLEDHSSAAFIQYNLLRGKVYAALGDVRRSIGKLVAEIRVNDTPGRAANEETTRYLVRLATDVRVFRDCYQSAVHDFSRLRECPENVSMPTAQEILDLPSSEFRLLREYRENVAVSSGEDILALLTSEDIAQVISAEISGVKEMKAENLFEAVFPSRCPEQGVFPVLLLSQQMLNSPKRCNLEDPTLHSVHRWPVISAHQLAAFFADDALVRPAFLCAPRLFLMSDGTFRELPRMHIASHTIAADNFL
ncbi:hypothetical protein B0H17DRAFT_1222915 [Mycena rosella]|uniref:Uncharacterized protein n=1 Tax=Mycena rosella TaxID=1033263 RepID=A0AAD7AX27_MYCRO|nr:hypothetical protein B0H17DRAFT_1222915 [Mycena rosella]